jgi:hypothetical protein
MGNALSRVRLSAFSTAGPTCSPPTHRTVAGVPHGAAASPAESASDPDHGGEDSPARP